MGRMEQGKPNRHHYQIGPVWAQALVSRAMEEKKQARAGDRKIHEKKKCKKGRMRGPKKVE